MPKTQTKNLEIEGFFGNLDASGRFVSDIGPSNALMMDAILSENKAFSKVLDFHLVYDYYCLDGTRVRFNNQLSGITVSRIKKDKMGHCDFKYQIDGSSSSHGLLGNLLRVRFNTEENIPKKEGDVFAEFKSVKISLKKTFVSESKTCPGVLFSFDLTQYWTGDSVKEAEAKMNSGNVDNSAHSLEIEAIVPLGFPAKENDLYLVLSSLLLKLEDLFVVPYQRQVAPLSIFSKFIEA